MFCKERSLDLSQDSRSRDEQNKCYFECYFQKVWLSSSQPSGRPGSVKLVCQLDDQVTVSTDLYFPVIFVLG